MSKVQTLRALVLERLAAASEEISALFERATAEHEEELCLSEDENMRIQRLLDQALSRRVLMNRGLNQDFTETAWIKEEPEEQSVSQEEEQMPVSVPESGAVRVKTDDSSELQQRQTEHREETQGEDISSELHVHSKTEGHTEHSSDTDNEDDWEPPFSCSAAQMDEDKSRPDRAVRKKHQCPFCTKGFRSNYFLRRHIRIHTGERPYSCSACSKAFVSKSDLTIHVRTHTGERPYSCSACSKAFVSKSDLTKHVRTHTGERPYSCSTCSKAFVNKSDLTIHVRTHTGERPYSCPACSKAFVSKSALIRHIRTHTGERPYSCSTCNKTFAQKDNLNVHTATHTRERPFTCPSLNEAFADKYQLKTPMSTHGQDKAQSSTEGNVFKV